MSKRTKFTARQLKYWREGMGYSLRKAAEALGCSKAALVNWEAGTYPVPQYIGLACEAVQNREANRQRQHQSWAKAS
jgi:transcriptional regulator with XRE-family HTH domain